MRCYFYVKISEVITMLMTIAILGLMLAVTGITLMFQEIFIPAPLLTVSAGGIILSFYVISIAVKKTNPSKANRLMAFTITLFIVLTMASLAFELWLWEQMVTGEFMMKLTLVLFEIGRASCRERI